MKRKNPNIFCEIFVFYVFSHAFTFNKRALFFFFLREFRQAQWHIFYEEWFFFSWCFLVFHSLGIQSNLVIRNGLIRNKLVLRNHFSLPIANLLHKDKEHLELRNNFRVTEKFLISTRSTVLILLLKGFHPITHHSNRRFRSILILTNFWQLLSGLCTV